MIFLYNAHCTSNLYERAGWVFCKSSCKSQKYLNFATGLSFFTSAGLHSQVFCSNPQARVSISIVSFLHLALLELASSLISDLPLLAFQCLF